VPALAHELAWLIGPFQNAAPLIIEETVEILRQLDCASDLGGKRKRRLEADVLRARYSFEACNKSTLTAVTPVELG
jgi:hypothetical protein